MSLVLPRPAQAYDPADEAKARALIEQADKQNMKTGANIEIVGNQALILRSPNGTRWQLTVSNAGASVWTAL